MGVTIHFEGRLRSVDAMPAIRSIASKWAARWKCKLIEIDDPMKELIRVRNEKVCMYESPVTGVSLRPHPDSEPLTLEFDSDLYVQHFCKTQFAPAQTHIEVIEMLKELVPHFEYLTVVDEGGYWETGDREHLEKRLALHFDLINKVKANDGALIAPYLTEEDGEKDPLKNPKSSPN